MPDGWVASSRLGRIGLESTTLGVGLEKGWLGKETGSIFHRK